MFAQRVIWTSIRKCGSCKNPPAAWREKFSPPCNIAPCVFIDKPMECAVSKCGTYQNPEYKSYHGYSYLDIQLQLDKYRLEQPVAEATDCRGELAYPKASEPKCGEVTQC